MESSYSLFEVGTTVRACLPDQSNIRRRATIATLQGSTACILWEDDAPRSLSSGESSTSFLICPRVQDNQEERDSIVPIKDLSPLFDFELRPKRDEATVHVYKDRGDALLRLGDVSAAAAYYEEGLKLSSRPQVGGTVLVKVNGHAKLADVDCIEGDSVDISLSDSGKEATLQTDSILLAVLDPDPDRLQERILLNLARCLLRLGESASLQRASLYRRSAVLACTLALAVVEYHDGDDSSPSNAKLTSLLLRSKAQAALSKHAHAKADLRRLLSLDPQNKEGQSLLQKVERQKEMRQRADKRLAKEVSKWVDTAMKTSVSSGPIGDDDDEIEVDSKSLQVHNSEASLHSSPSDTFSFLLVAAALGILLVWMYQNSFGGQI